MEATLEDYLVNKAHLPSVTYFETDIRGIVNVKAEFAAEAAEFLWLRKGEDAGAEIIGTLLAAVNALTDERLVDTLKDIFIYERTLDLIWRSWKAIGGLIVRAREKSEKTPVSGRRPKDLRILCRPTTDTEAARELYEVQGYSVRHYRDERLAGFHRFYVNEKRYCLFVRTHEKRFVGLIGNDGETISKLKATFEAEWEGAKEPSPKAR